ncbi:MAG: histidine kinase [Burkholderiales bacterium]|nr:histidine kinase [Burkholderiales bacterium]
MKHYNEATLNRQSNLADQLFRRLVGISLVLLLGSALLLLLYAQRNIGRESAVVPKIGKLLAALETAANPQQATALVAQLDRINEEDEFRQFRIELLDAQGKPLTKPQQSANRTPGFLESWLNQPDGKARVATHEKTLQNLPGLGTVTLRLQSNPQTEADEALEDGMVALGGLLGLATLLYGAIRLTLKNTFEPLQNSLAEQVRSQRELTNRLQDLQEHERRQLAHELHDEFGQTLTAIQVDAATIAKQSHNHPLLQASVQALLHNTHTILQQLRSLLKQLRPSGLEADENQNLALQASIEDLLNTWRQRPGQTTQFSADIALTDTPLPGRLAIATFRITQEALTNIARHAQAQQVHISIKTDAQKQTLTVEIKDDGIGNAANHNPVPHSIRERTLANSGECSVVANHPKGWTLQVKLPLLNFKQV